MDLKMSIATDLDDLKKNIDKLKMSGMGKELNDVDVKTLDWLEDNKKVKAVIIYETSL